MNEVIRSEITSVEQVVMNEVEIVREKFAELAQHESANRRLLLELQQGQEALQKNVQSCLRDFRIDEDKRIVNYVKKSLDIKNYKERRSVEWAEEKQRRKLVHGRVGDGGGSYSVEKPCTDVSLSSLQQGTTLLYEDDMNVEDVPASVMSERGPPQYPRPRNLATKEPFVATRGRDRSDCDGRGGRRSRSVTASKSQSRQRKENEPQSDPNID
ncbi:unnamed protein product, partial [Symbiodinium microadriaticum]